jgi:hypothetical protein
MSERETYTAVCEREGEWWVVHVPELGNRATQARRLDQVDRVVRSLVHLITDKADDSFDVRLTVPSLEADMAEVHSARAEAEAAEERAATASRRAASRLRRMGLPMRDVGTLLGVSHQRASQLLSGKAARNAARC